MRKQVIENLKLRLGYKNEVLLSIDEFNAIIDIDPEDQAEFEERIDELETELSHFESDQEDVDELKEEIEELKGKLEKITQIIEE